jgi:hypothetical protein
VRFNQNFAVAFMLPAALFFVVSFAVMNGFSVLTYVFHLSESRILVGILMLGLVTWSAGVCLFMLNTQIIKLMEGYGRYNPARMFLWIQKRRFKKLCDRISKLDAQYKQYLSNGKEFPLTHHTERNALMLKQVSEFPDQERFILPTAFGNRLKTFCKITTTSDKY